MIKIGDRVKFLNEVGGGIVVAYQTRNIVLVRTPDGFEIPTLTSDVIPDPIEAETKAVSPAPGAKTAEPVVAKVNPKPATTFERRGGDMLHFLLTFVTYVNDEAEKMLEIYLVNDSNYTLTYSLIALENTAATVRYEGSLEPNTKIFLEEISYARLGEWERILVQGIALKRNKPFSPKEPFSTKLRIEGSKFYRPGTFRSSDFFEDPALSFEIVKE